MSDDDFAGMSVRTWATWSILGLILSAAVVVLGDAPMLTRQVLAFAACALLLPVWVVAVREGATRIARWLRRGHP